MIDAQIVQDKAKMTKAKKKLERRFERNFNKWREFDLLTCLIAIVGLALAIVDWEYTRISTHNITVQKGVCVDVESVEGRADCMGYFAQERLLLSQSNFVRVVIVIVSAMGIVTLSFRHMAKARWLNEDLPVELMNSQYYMTKSNRAEVFEAQGFKRRLWLSASFWWEATIFLFCPIPFHDWLWSIDVIDINHKKDNVKVYYLVSDFILVVMFLRVFFVIRAIFNYNMYTDVFAKKLCRSYGFTANVRFTFKSLLKTDPARTVLVTMLSSVLILAYILRVFEVQYYKAIA